MVHTLRLCAGLAGVLLISCAPQDGLRSFEGLEQRFADYYSLEQRKDWSAAYEFRTKAFRESVTKERYVSQMEKDNAGWRLVKYRIESISEKSGKVHLKMTFVETPPAGFMKEHLPPGKELTEMETEDESIWIREGGIWYAYAPGTRARLSLNIALVP